MHACWPYFTVSNPQQSHVLMLDEFILAGTPQFCLKYNVMRYIAWRPTRVVHAFQFIFITLTIFRRNFVDRNKMQIIGLRYFMLNFYALLNLPNFCGMQIIKTNITNFLILWRRNCPCWDLSVLTMLSLWPFRHLAVQDKSISFHLLLWLTFYSKVVTICFTQLKVVIMSQWRRRWRNM